jgi:hypothetical protein
LLILYPIHASAICSRALDRHIRRFTNRRSACGCACFYGRFTAPALIYRSVVEMATQMAFSIGHSFYSASVAMDGRAMRDGDCGAGLEPDRELVFA